MLFIYHYPKYHTEQIVRYINNRGNYCKGVIKRMITDYMQITRNTLKANHSYLIVSEGKKVGIWIHEDKITEIVKSKYKTK